MDNYNNYNYVPADQQQPAQPTDPMYQMPPVESQPEEPKKKPKNVKKLVVTLVSVLLVLAVLGAGVYWVLYNHVFFPSIDEALINSLEPKLAPKFNFDGKAFENSGMLKAELLDISKLAEDEETAEKLKEFKNVSVSVAFDMKKKAVGVFGTFCDEKVSIIANEKGLAVNENNFNDGTYYGVAFDKFIEKLEKSIFGPDSDTDYAIPEEVFDMIKQMFDTLDKDNKDTKEIAKDVKVLYDEIMKVVSKSEVFKAETKYFGVEVLGNGRAGRSQTFVVNEKKVKALLKELSDIFADPSKQFEKSLENVLKYVDDTMSESGTGFGFDMDADELCEMLEEALDEVASSVGSMDFEFTLELVYYGRALSAVVLTPDMEDGSGYIAIDFGEKPQKDTTVNVEYVSKYSYENYGGEKTKYEDSTKIEYSLEKADNSNTFKVVFDTSEKENGKKVASNVMSGELVFDSKAGEASVKFSNTRTTKYSEEENTYSNTFTAKADFVDTKDEWSLVPKSFSMNDGDEEAQTVEIPVLVKIALLKNTEKLDLPKYTNVLDMSEDDVDTILEDIMKFGQDFVQKYSEKFGEEGFPDVDFDIPGLGGDVEAPSDSPSSTPSVGGYGW